MRGPNPGDTEPRLELREDVKHYEPPETAGEPDVDQLERVADHLRTIQEVERYMADFYSKCQRQGVVEALDEAGHDDDEEFVVLKQQDEGYYVDDRFVLGERQETLAYQLPEYRQRIVEAVGDLIAFEEGHESERIYRPLRETLEVVNHGVENEHDLEVTIQELDRADRDIIRHYVEDRKGQGQRHDDPMDEFVTRSDEYALDKLFGDVQTIALDGVDALHSIEEEYRSWGRKIGAEMERRRRMRRDDGDEPLEPWEYRLTKDVEDEPSYIQ